MENYDKGILAGFKRASGDILRQIYEESVGSDIILSRLAENPNTPQDILLKIADGGFVYYLLNNPNINSAVLSKILDNITFYDDDVRASEVCRRLETLIEHRNIGSPVLVKLFLILQDKGDNYERIKLSICYHERFDFHAAFAISRDKRANGETLRWLMDGHWNRYYSIIGKVLEHDNCPVDLLDRYVHSGYDLCKKIAENKNITLEIWEKLIRHNNAYIVQKLAELPNIEIVKKLDEGGGFRKVMEKLVPNSIPMEVISSEKFSLIAGRNCKICREYDPYADVGNEGFVCYKCR